MTILQRVQANPYIVRYVDSFQEGSNTSLIIEYCEKGDLANYLQRVGSHMVLAESRIWRVIIQLCVALEELHS